MSERETKEFTTPGGLKLVVKTFLTGREVNEVLKKLFGAREISAQSDGSAAAKLPIATGIDRNVFLIEAAVVSFEGSAENILERILDLPAKEYTAILNEVKSLADGNF